MYPCIFWKMNLLNERTFSAIFKYILQQMNALLRFSMKEVSNYFHYFWLQNFWLQKFQPTRNERSWKTNVFSHVRK